MVGPIWLSVARAFVGLREVAGKTSNAMIMRWARDLGAPSWYDDDDKAWCALFPNRIFLALGIPLSGTGFDLVRALTFKTWGVPVDPIPGALLVFVRPEGGHVGFYISETATHFQVLGGNQSNQVSYTWIAKDRLVASRWPADYPVDGQPLIVAARTGAVSENEA